MPELAVQTHVALLGCDHPHSRSHLETLCSLQEAIGIHLWDPDPGAAEGLREAAGEKLVAVHPELDGLLADDRVGWILASLRNDVSPGVLARCAAAGKPVLSEKPMGRSRAEVELVVAAFQQADVPLAVCFQNRHKPAARQIHAWLADGLLGRLCAAETRLHTTQVALRNPRHWLFSNNLSGGGILPWLGCHYLDLLRWLMGAEAVEVTCQCATLSGEDIDVEDMAVLTLRFDNEVLASATFGYLMPGGRPGYIQPGYDTYIGFKGTGGQLSWVPTTEPSRIDIVSFHDDWLAAPQRTVTMQEEGAKAYGQRAGLEFARECLKAAQDRRDGPTSGADMLAIWAIIEAAYRSQRDGVRVEL